MDGKVSIGYVGYCFNPRVNDCVFILPKVLLEVDADKRERVFGKYPPEEIVDMGDGSPLTPDEREFIYRFSVWIYHWIENYLEKYFLVGCCKDAAHRGWILGRSKFKRMDLYNVRLGERAGAVVADAALTRSPKFLILYDVASPSAYSVYRIKSGMRYEKARMVKMGYTSAKGDYYCYVLDEEVSLGDLDVAKLLADWKREKGDDFRLGAPIYLKGGELIGFRRG